MKPLYITFGAAGLLLAGAFAAQAHVCPPVEGACVLCQDQCGGNWPADGGSFQGTGSKNTFLSKGCVPPTLTKAGNPELHLCCANVLPACPTP
jgi:hypothetical protein